MKNQEFNRIMLEIKVLHASVNGKEILKGKDGCNLVCILPEQITSPTITAEWENTLMEIERGNADADAFLSGIVRMTGDLVKAYPFLSDAEAQRFGTGKEEIGKCPRCGSPVYVGKGNFYCSNKACSFCLWEDNKFFSSKKKKLTKRETKRVRIGMPVRTRFFASVPSDFLLWRRKCLRAGDNESIRERKKAT